MKKVALDVTPIQESREFRLLSIGGTISALGAQMALVALPIQIYVISHSAALVGLLGLFELGPMIVVSLVGGALADRRDRRPVLATAQVAMIFVTGLLAVLSLTVPHPPVIAILVLGGVLAGSTSLDGVARNSMIPGILGSDLLRSGLAFNYGMYQAAGIVGPGIGGLLMGALGGTSKSAALIYVLDGISCLGMLWAALAIGPQPPHAVKEHLPVREAIVEGLRFVGSKKALAGSLVIDINAMLFGMPRALFVVLSVTIYHAGAGGTGLLYSAIAVGGTMSVLTSGWVQHVNRLGRLTIAMVTLWGAAIGASGLVDSIFPAAVLLALAGWADGLSAVCRSTIGQTLTPDRMRGRMSSVFSLVVTSGPRLGDIESGLLAGLVGAMNAVLIGGVGCILGVGATVLAFPQLAAYEADVEVARMKREGELEPAETVVTT